jgi:flagellar basal-body rod protein FlgG
MPNTLERLYMIGQSALQARQFELDQISDNLANVNTPAFKMRRAAFEAALGQAALSERRGVEISAAAPDFGQGPIEYTGESWDLAIDGPGLFVLRVPDGGQAYTRMGTFHLDGDGHLVNHLGYNLDPGIAIPPGAENVIVDARGVVTATVNRLPQTLGRIQLGRCPNPEGLVDQGGGIFTLSPAAGGVVLGAPTENGMGQVLVGALEGSNVDTADQLIRLLHTQRAYGMTLRALQISDQMTTLTNQLQG